jgi:hypothetical protein
MRKQFGQNEARGEMRLSLRKMIFKQALLCGSVCWVLCQQNRNINKQSKRPSSEN